MNALPSISVCIPAFNRAEVLRELLDSILKQDYERYDIVIVEDRSPERETIRQIVDEYQQRSERIHYFENEENLGYDGNLRRTLSVATGQYCFFMGNDDLMCDGALRAVGEGIARYDNIGVVLRSWASFEEDPSRIVATTRYFDDERFFPAGADTITTFFRRSVVIPGMVLRREDAVAYATTELDGYTLYQCWLVGNMLATSNGIFLPQVLVLYRLGNAPLFGSSEAEKGKFVPGEHTPEGSLFFLRGLLHIAKAVEQRQKISVARPIMTDVAHYAYPFLMLQAKLPFVPFTRYAIAVAREGLGRSPLFYIYYIALAVLGPERCNRLVAFVKRKLGRTPAFGHFSGGVPRA